MLTNTRNAFSGQSSYQT